LRVADMFFAEICVILSFDCEFLVLEFHVNNAICRINDTIIFVVVFVAVFTLLINALY